MEDCVSPGLVEWVIWENARIQCQVQQTLMYSYYVTDSFEVSVNWRVIYVFTASWVLANKQKNCKWACSCASWQPTQVFQFVKKFYCVIQIFEITWILFIYYWVSYVHWVLIEFSSDTFPQVPGRWISWTIMK